jgi:hypothetical protein
MNIVSGIRTRWFKQYDEYSNDFSNLGSNDEMNVVSEISIRKQSDFKSD